MGIKKTVRNSNVSVSSRCLQRKVWKPSEVRLYLISNFAGDCGKTGLWKRVVGHRICLTEDVLVNSKPGDYMRKTLFHPDQWQGVWQRGSVNAVHLASGFLRATCAIVWPRRIFSNMAEGSESQPNNPLSRKLNKILETRLDNDKVKAFLYPSVFSW